MSTSLATIRDHLSRFVRALRPARPELLPISTAPQVRAFVPATENGRYAELAQSCELLAPGFEQLDGLMASYLEEVDRGLDSSTADAERFLEWLTTRVDLTEAQLDMLVSLQSRYTVEFVAVKQRLAHARFQELRSNNGRLLKELGRNSRIQIQLNPVHVWATLETHVYLDDEATVPATVLFYGIERGVEGAVIENDVLPLIRLLERRTCQLTTLQKSVPRYSRSEVLELVRELARLGIVALS